MEPVPTSFHLGPFLFHTYGFGLAIAIYVAFRYAERRFTKRGLGVQRFGLFAIIMVVLGVLGARLAHVATNWSYYEAHLAQTLAIWQGGLSSFGGLVLAAPVGYLLARRWWPDVKALEFADAFIPALVLGWALGRFLGPQFMVNGGGHVTHQWFGLHYAGQSGRRVPVPLIQGLEDSALLALLVVLERRGLAKRRGVVTGVALLVWGVVRSVDERLLLGEEGHSGSLGVQIAGIALAVLGLAILTRAALRPKAAVSD